MQSCRFLRYLIYIDKSLRRSAHSPVKFRSQTRQLKSTVEMQRRSISACYNRLHRIVCNEKLFIKSCWNMHPIRWQKKYFFKWLFFERQCNLFFSASITSVLLILKITFDWLNVYVMYHRIGNIVTNTYSQYNKNTFNVNKCQKKNNN